MTHPRHILLLSAALVLLAVALPSPAFAGGGKGHTAVAAQTVNRTLARAGIRSAVVSTKVVKLSTKAHGNRITVSCQVEVFVASKHGTKLGPGQSATIKASGRITAVGRSARTARRAKTSCVREVASDVAKRRVTPFVRR